MKNIFSLKLFMTLSLILYSFGNTATSQNLGVNSSGSSPDPSAALDIDFTNKGILIPRVELQSITDVTTINNPTTSLLVYNKNAGMTDGAKGFYYYDGSKWVQALGGSPEPTGGTCTDCITEVSHPINNGGTMNWITCADSCINLGTGWRIPTVEEEINVVMNLYGPPPGGRINGFVWTTTYSPTSNGNWLNVHETLGRQASISYNSSYNCRCVK